MLKAFLKKPFPFKDICMIYPPSVNDILTKEKYDYYHNILTISQEEIEDALTEQDKISSIKKIPTPLEFLIIQAYNDSQAYKMIKEAFELFCHCPITILFDKKEIWLCDLEKELETISDVNEILKFPKLTEDNYFDFQNHIRLSLGEEQAEKPNPDEHPKIKAMKAKARLRDRIKAKQGGGISLEKSLVAICCMGIGLTPLNIGEISLAAVKPIMETQQEKDKYELDIKSVLAGAKKVKPKYWIHN